MHSSRLLQYFGYHINMNKSCILFSANASEEKMRELENALQIGLTNNLGKYLGLSSLWGR